MMFFRKAIVLIHGFAGGPWDHQNLSNELQLFIDFDVYNIILPGHDKSIITNVKRNDWISSVECLCDKLIDSGYKTIYVMGHSMGGVIATYIATKYKQVKKLILVAPAFKYLKFKDNKLDVINSLKTVPSVFKEYEEKEVIGRILKVPIPTTLEFTHLVKEHTDDVKNVSVPTLIIQGDKDSIVPYESSLYVHDNIKSEVNILAKMKGVTHDVFNGSRGEDAISLIKEFLRKKHFKKGKFKIEI